MSDGAEQLGRDGSMTPARLRVLATAGTGVVLKMTSEQARALANVLDADELAEESIARALKAAEAARAASERSRLRYHREIKKMQRANVVVWLIVSVLVGLAMVFA